MNNVPRRLIRYRVEKTEKQLTVREVCMYSTARKTTRSLIFRSQEQLTTSTNTQELSATKKSTRKEKRGEGKWEVFVRRENEKWWSFQVSASAILPSAISHGPSTVSVVTQPNTRFFPNHMSTCTNAACRQLQNSLSQKTIIIEFCTAEL